MVAARRPVAGRGEPLRGGVRREHGDAFDAQRPAVHDVVVVALHRQELAVADGGDHAAPARAEVARGGELADVRELQVLRRGPHRGNVEEPAERESCSTAEGQPEQVSAVDCRRRCATPIHGLPRRDSGSEHPRFIHGVASVRLRNGDPARARTVRSGNSCERARFRDGSRRPIGMVARSGRARTPTFRRSPG